MWANVLHEISDSNIWNVIQLISGDGSGTAEVTATLVDCVKTKEPEKLPHDLLRGLGQRRIRSQASEEVIYEDRFRLSFGNVSGYS